jgi:hypothetical protein
MKLGYLVNLISSYKNVCERIKFLENKIRFLKMRQHAVEKDQTVNFINELEELRLLKKQLFNMNTNSACFECSWSNNQYDFDTPVTYGRCSHCEFSGADQCDNYPDAKETCSGFEKKDFK